MPNVRFSRVLGGIGRAMIAAGVLLLLFVAYQLWGTGIRTDAAQTGLKSDYCAAHPGSVSCGGSGTLPSLDQGEGAAGAPGSSTSVAPASTAPPGSAVPASGDYPPPKPGEPIGRIVIPKIGADFYMVEGVDLSYLSEGPGHFPGTPFPGQAGNAALAGHRTTWKAPFNRIDELSPGDMITIQTPQGEFTYKVEPAAGEPSLGYRIVTPTSTDILDQPAPGGDNTLTLMACHPKYSAAQRIVVVAKLTNNPAPTTNASPESQSEARSGSNGLLTNGSSADLIGNNPDARNPAIYYSLLAALVWLIAWLIARRFHSWRTWKTWVVYLVALPFFLVPLFFAFENINHLLPAGY